MEPDFTIVAGAVHTTVSDALIHIPAIYGGGRNFSTNRRLRGTVNDKLSSRSLVST